ncbi:Retrovirus-related Pol polyprotein from transposon RE1 [Senna tora]|uniref:Retrovirus-related Pol polyprotein from transposon RE1 n=1 Tax=Senna tora TaxID=362788 RepID=A0A834WEU7_9FABA|nr:Retrovirus-related Pol polyprotein from transposon RE1 [Senna tora]
MREAGAVEEALPAKHEGGWRNKGSKNKQNQQGNREDNYCLIKDATGQDLFKVKRDKLDKKATARIFIGYSTVSKAYKVFQPETETITISRDVHFMENEEWNWEDSKTPMMKTNSLLDEREDDPPN